MAISLLHFTAFFQGEDNSIKRAAKVIETFRLKLVPLIKPICQSCRHFVRSSYRESSRSTAKDGDILCEARIVNPAGPQPKMQTFCVTLVSSIQLVHSVFTNLFINCFTTAKDGDILCEARIVNPAGPQPKMLVSSIQLVHSQRCRHFVRSSYRESSWSTAKDADILCDAGIVDPAGPQPKMQTFCVTLVSSIQLVHRTYQFLRQVLSSRQRVVMELIVKYTIFVFCTAETAF
ncbi:unnamed protein product [Boreogadus saida]